MKNRILATASALAAMALIAVIFQNCSSDESKPSLSELQSAYTQYEMTSAEAQDMFSDMESNCTSIVSLSASYPVIATGGSINLNSGSANHRISQVTTVEGSGSANLVGTVSGASIGTISGVVGNINVCNASINKVTGGLVNIYLEGGTLSEIVNVSGNILINGGTGYPSNIVNFGGNIVIKTNSGTYMGRSYLGNN